MKKESALERSLAVARHDRQIDDAVAVCRPIERRYKGLLVWTTLTQAEAVACVANGDHAWLRVKSVEPLRRPGLPALAARLAAENPTWSTDQALCEAKARITSRPAS